MREKSCKRATCQVSAVRDGAHMGWEKTKHKFGMGDMSKKAVWGGRLQHKWEKCGLQMVKAISPSREGQNRNFRRKARPALQLRKEGKGSIATWEGREGVHSNLRRWKWASMALGKVGKGCISNWEGVQCMWRRPAFYMGKMGNSNRQGQRIGGRASVQFEAVTNACGGGLLSKSGSEQHMWGKTETQVWKVRNTCGRGLKSDSGGWAPRVEEVWDPSGERLQPESETWAWHAK